ncbi:MAG TPA: outer membrane protein assembly factor BamD [Candidatus Polarisedimenticolia bacterium]|nr:outer membrane protein assembly factor BamD [Candidatus Polarisedimenticolia bacterium]
MSSIRRPWLATLALITLATLCAMLHGCAARRRERQERLPPEQIYAMAMEKMAHKRYYTARGMLQEALPRIPPEDRILLPKVQLAIADSFYKDGGSLNFGEALNGYRNFLTYFPQHEEADRAQFMVGMSLFKQVLAPDREQSLTLKAIDEFRKVETIYPDSAFVQQGRDQILLCQDRLAEHERVVGWFYQRRKAWPAAIDRYRQILETYPRYSATSRVLYDLGRCLLAQGNRAEAEQALDRLAHDDPQGPFAVKAKDLLARYDHGKKKEVGKERKP